MTIPDFQSIMLPLLKSIEDGQEHSTKETLQTLATHFGLTEEQLNEMLPSRNQTIFYNRITWAKVSNLENLLLYHISLEQLQNSEETLNDIVDSISEVLRTETISLNKFKSKLYEVGYFDLQRNLYENIGYRIRQDDYYKVENDFPRIEENDIRAGIGDVKYSIILSQCTPFVINETEVFNIVKP